MKTPYKCVLFIDDDKATNFFNERIAKKYGDFNKIITLQSAISGLEYLNKCTTEDLEKPSIIFLDLNMPAMNGWEFLNEFNKLSDKIIHGIKVVILSTSEAPTDLNLKDISTKLLCYLNKPLSKGSLEKVMTKLLKNA